VQGRQSEAGKLQQPAEVLSKKTDQDKAVAPGAQPSFFETQPKKHSEKTFDIADGSHNGVTIQDKRDHRPDESSTQSM
jgi:hypothetical protein